LDNVLISAGIACLIGAIVGGGLKAFGIEIPLLASVRRQSLLGLLGALLLGLGFGDRLMGVGGGKAEIAPANQAAVQPEQKSVPAPAKLPEQKDASVSAGACAHPDDAFALTARLANYAHSLADPSPADRPRRLENLATVAKVMEILPIGTPSELEERIRAHLSGPGPITSCPVLRTLFETIEQQTGEAIP
jgi:hypothetical protein